MKEAKKSMRVYDATLPATRVRKRTKKLALKVAKQMNESLGEFIRNAVIAYALKFKNTKIK